MRQDFLFIETEKAFLVITNLVNVDMVKASLDIFTDAGKVGLGVWATDHLFGDLLLRQHARRLLKVGDRAQFLGKFALQTGVGPLLLHGRLGIRFIGSPTDSQLPITGSRLIMRLAARVKIIDKLLFG